MRNIQTDSPWEEHRRGQRIRLGGRRKPAQSSFFLVSQKSVRSAAGVAGAVGGAADGATTGQTRSDTRQT